MKSSNFWRSNVSQDEITRVTDAYKEAEKTPQISSAFTSLDESGDQVLIGSDWYQPSIVAGKKREFSKLFSFNLRDNAIIYQSPPIQTEDSDKNTAFGPSGLKCVIYKNNSGNFMLEVWNGTGIAKSFNLTDLDLHGQVYFDEYLGCLTINKSGTVVAYIAEEKRTKETPFFKTKISKNVSESKDFPSTGNEYSYVEDWGEQMVGKSQTVIVTLDLLEDNFQIWSRGNGSLPENVCPGQMVWINDETLAGIAIRTDPRRLGLFASTNRECSVFQLDISGAVKNRERFKKLAPGPLIAFKHLRLSPDRKTLVWLERDLAEGGYYPGTHQACFRLMALDLATTSIRTVTDVVRKFEPGVDDFAGIFLVGKFPKRIFIDNETLVFSTPILDTLYPVIFNLTNGSVTVIKDQPDLIVLDAHQNILVGSKSNYFEAPHLVLGKWSSETQSFTFHDLIRKIKGNSPADGFIYQSRVHTPQIKHPDPSFEDVKFSSVYIGPEVGESGSVPLIVWPHGGPHSVFLTSHDRDVEFFNNLGFAVLMVNFRGSLGNGQDGILSIVDNLGDVDVKDCHQAMLECVAEYPHINPAKVVLFGGSHGGFLVVHLASQYPTFYRAVVARNPVINVAVKALAADNPTWKIDESETLEDFQFMLTNPDYFKFYFEKSPIRYVRDIEAPLLLLVGKNDRRVSPTQSLELYHSMKALEKEVDMNVYDDGHSLAKTVVAANVFVNAVLFFNAILAKISSK